MRPRTGRFRDRGAVDEIAVGRARASATSLCATRGTANRDASTAERSHSRTDTEGSPWGDRKLPAVRLYTAAQKVNHRRLSYEEDLVALLDEHGVAYDERYLRD